MGLRVHVHSGMLSESTGYGKVGVGLIRALMRRGYEVSIETTIMAPPLDRDIAMLVTVEPKPPFDLYISSAPPTQMGIPARFQHDIYKSVAWTMWEFSSFTEQQEREVRARIDAFLAKEGNQILVYDHDSKAAFDSLDTGIEFKVVQGGYEPDVWTATDIQRDWDAPTFRVGIAGELSARKDPYVAMRAVQRLADEGLDIEFWVKSVQGEVPKVVMERYPAVKVMDGRWTNEKMRTFYSMLHCYVAPSWGEGLNLPAVEAGTAGAALLVSDVAGHRGWAMDGEVATLLAVKAGRIEDDMWSARVVEDDLVDRLRDLATNREYARQRGAQAAKMLPAILSWDRVLDRFLEAVK